jgi:hypothetical protein
MGADTMKPGNSRRNLRANLHLPVRVVGTDRSGKPVDIEGESVNMSRGGLGIIVDEDLLERGSVVSLYLPKRLRSNAIVQWVRPEEGNGKVQMGVRLIHSRTNVAFRLVVGLLLMVILLAQMSSAKPRKAPSVRPASAGCAIGMKGMQDLFARNVAKRGGITEGDRAFVHFQHQQMSCEEYTKRFEKSNFQPDGKRRSAVAKWHWQQYHSADVHVRAAALEGLESLEGNGPIPSGTEGEMQPLSYR